MLEAWHMVRKYTHIFGSRNIRLSSKALLILLMSTFFAKNQRFLEKMIPLLKAIVWELCYILFSSVFRFRKIKEYCKWKCKFHRLCIRNPASRLLQIALKSKKWQWRPNISTWRPHQTLLTLFCFFCQF